MVWFGPYFTYVKTCDATPCCNLCVIHAFILCHSCLTFNNSNGKLPNRENQAQKVLKSEMFEMLVFCCKLHRNLMIHENVMLQLHGKIHTKWVFSKNPHVFYKKTHVFTLVHFFCKQNEGIAQRKICQSWEYDGFSNTWEACALMRKH